MTYENVDFKKLKILLFFCTVFVLFVNNVVGAQSKVSESSYIAPENWDWADPNQWGDFVIPYPNGQWRL